MSRRGWLLFGGVSVLWGCPYALIKVALDDGVPPAFLAWARVALGAVVLLGLAQRAGTLTRVRGRLGWLTVFAVVEIAVPYVLLGIGERHVSSSLAAILIAAAPLLVAVVGVRFDASERVGGARLAGLIAGLLGVVVLVGVDVAGHGDELAGAAAVLTVAVCYAVGPMVLKRRLADLDPRAAMGASLAVATVLLAPGAALDRPTGVPPAAALGALMGLGLLCTAAALALYGALVVEAGAGRALVVTYVNPVVAVGLGVALLGERPGPGALAGLPLILVGSWLATGGRTRSQVERPSRLELLLRRSKPCGELAQLGIDSARVDRGWRSEAGLKRADVVEQVGDVISPPAVRSPVQFID